VSKRRSRSSDSSDCQALTLCASPSLPADEANPTIVSITDSGEEPWVSSFESGRYAGQPAAWPSWNSADAKRAEERRRVMVDVFELEDGLIALRVLRFTFQEMVGEVWWIHLQAGEINCCSTRPGVRVQDNPTPPQDSGTIIPYQVALSTSQTTWRHHTTAWTLIKSHCTYDLLTFSFPVYWPPAPFPRPLRL
jgi:hypothetical protein